MIKDTLPIRLINLVNQRSVNDGCGSEHVQVAPNFQFGKEGYVHKTHPTCSSPINVSCFEARSMWPKTFECLKLQRRDRHVNTFMSFGDMRMWFPSWLLCVFANPCVGRNTIFNVKHEVHVTDLNEKSWKQALLPRQPAFEACRFAW